MRGRHTLWVALALIVVGTIGLVVLSAIYSSVAPRDPYSSNGQRIYYTGGTANGLIPRTVAGAGLMGYGMMRDLACVDCHGGDGRGGGISMMFGTIQIPDIRYSALTTSRSEDGTIVPAWTDRDIARAIVDGIEPNGQILESPMARWGMTDTEVSDVIAYLKELDRR